MKSKGFFNININMYVYIIKCANFYKIGFSKNPNSRLKTVKTHNPLDVIIAATIKTEHHLSLEKELHGLFSNKRSRGEWFELSEDDLTTLKIEYGFSFKKPISKLCEIKEVNKEMLEEIKKVRVNNHLISEMINYFEEVFYCTVNNKTELRKVCMNYSLEIIKDAIDSLFKQGNTSDQAYRLLYKVCNNMYNIKHNPREHVIKIIKAIWYKQYGEVLHKNDIEHINDNLDCDNNDVNDMIKKLNSQKFYLDSDELFTFIIDNYCSFRL